MAEKMSKDEFLEQIRVKHRQLERYLFYFERGSNGAFVASNRPKFGREEMLEPGVVGEWSVKELLAHLIAREQRFLNWYGAGLRGDVPEAPVVKVSRDGFEALVLEIEKYRSHSLEDILAEFMTSFEQVLATVQTIPEADLFAPGRFAWTEDLTLADYIAANTFHRYDWAKRQIRHWKTKHTGKQLNKDIILEKIRAERRRLEKNLAELNADEMIQPGVVGEWSVKDLLAHLVDWEQRFLRWYDEGLCGLTPETPEPGLTWRDLDILNQRIFGKHRHRPLDDVLAEFHASYQQVLKTIEAMPEEDLIDPDRFEWRAGNPLWTMAAANTSNHYRWAKTQLRKWLRARNV